MVRDTLLARRSSEASGLSGGTSVDPPLRSIKHPERPADASPMAAPTSSKSLRLRRPDQCAACQTELAAGQEALWYRPSRVVTCLGCAYPPPETVEGVPGASAQREYDRRHDQREDRAREKLGVLGVFLARVTEEPQSTTAWKKGADGEARAGARLAKLLGTSGVRLLHDRRMPGSRSANIDHIAIGPGGITVIDTKNYQGKVRVQRVGGLFSERRDTLTIAGRDKTKHIDGIGRQMAAVASLLPQPDGDSIDIRGALCFADVDGLPLLRHLSVRNVIVDGPRTTAKLASRPGSLTPEQVDALWIHLGTTLPAA